MGILRMELLDDAAMAATDNASHETEVEHWRSSGGGKAAGKVRRRKKRSSSSNKRSKSPPDNSTHNHITSDGFVSRQLLKHG